MLPSDHKSTIREMQHQRRESELSAPVSDYEYFQFSPTVSRPPPTPSTPSAPPRYTGEHGYVSPPLGIDQTQTSDHDMNDPRGDNHANFPEVVPEGKNCKIIQVNGELTRF